MSGDCFLSIFGLALSLKVLVSTSVVLGWLPVVWSPLVGQQAASAQVPAATPHEDYRRVMLCS